MVLEDITPKNAHIWQLQQKSKDFATIANRYLHSVVLLLAKLFMNFNLHLACIFFCM